jgi:hypothetical protein
MSVSYRIESSRPSGSLGLILALAVGGAFLAGVIWATSAEMPSMKRYYNMTRM